MEEMTLKVQEPDGTIRHVKTIASDWDDIGNKIAEGYLEESDRYRLLYECTKRHLARASGEATAAYSAIRRTYTALAAIMNDLAKV